MINDIVQTLANAEKRGRAQQPAMIRPKAMTKIAQPKVNPNDYKLIGSALQELQLSKEYLTVFQAQHVRDSDLSLLDDGNLRELFVLLGPRVRFRAWLNEKRPSLQMEMKNGVIDQNEYRMVKQIFSLLKIVNPSRFILNFMNNGVNDQMLDCVNDHDLQTLIPSMSVRILFRKHLENMRRQKAVNVPLQQRHLQQQQQHQPQPQNNNYLF